ncbi:hypothetical protein FJTKL_08641 [Diaporthe vaccinii]|uniref:Uncharacterized protein n=1 Tax=Diaporthe vaccinii TaxID=105482 RepID=A0ABR4EQU3_9PEZI
MIDCVRAHDLVRVKVVIICSYPSSLGQVSQLNGLTGIGGEVKDNLIALSHRDSGRCGETYQIGNLDRISKQTRVTGNHLERQLPIDVGTQGKETETVLPRLDVEEWPWLPIHMDDIAPEAVGLTLSGEQCSVSIVLLGRQDKGDVVCAVSRREIQCVLGRISDDVGPSLAEISIFGRCTHIVNCVVVVPEQSGILLVGVVIILVFAGGRHIFCPTVERRPGIRSMQMDRVRDCRVVDESDHRLCSTRNHERRAWRHSIVSDQIRNTQVWVDRLGEWLDVHFVVLDFISRHRIGKDSRRPRIVSTSIGVMVCWGKCWGNLLRRLLDRRNWQSHFVDQGIFRAEPVCGLYRDYILRDVLNNTCKRLCLFWWYIINPLSLL